MQGRDLNRVQQFALEIAMMLDERRDIDKFLLELRINGIRDGVFDIPSENEIGADEDLSDTAGTWEFPNTEGLSNEEMENILASMTGGGETVVILDSKEMDQDQEQGWK